MKDICCECEAEAASVQRYIDGVHHSATEVCGMRLVCGHQRKIRECSSVEVGENAAEKRRAF